MGKTGFKIPWQLVAVSAVFFLLTAWMVLPAAPAGFDWDDTWYLWMAEWFSGRETHEATAWFMMQSRQYPPLFPMMLSLTGDVLESFRNGLVLNALLLATGTGVAMAWLVREGMSMMAATLGGLLIMFNPIALTFIPALMSEPLFMLLTVAAMSLAAARDGSSRWWLLIGLLAALSVATRSAGWSLVVALAVSLAWQRKPADILSCLAGVIIGFLYLFILKVKLPEAHSYMDGYLDNLRHIDGSFVMHQLSALWAGWAQLWGSAVGAIIAIVLVTPGWLDRLRGVKVDAWYVLVSLGMILSWPFPDQMSRFLWVLMPAFLIAAAHSLGLWKERAPRFNAGAVIMALLLLFSIPSGLGRQVDRLIDSPGQGLDQLSRMADWTRPDNRATALMNLRVRQQLILDMQRLAEIATDDSCIYSELPALVSIQARKVAYASPWNSLDAIRQENVTCPYYYLLPQALPGTGQEEVEAFSNRHLLLFNSMAPYDESGTQVLGAFYYLFPPDFELDSD